MEKRDFIEYLKKQMRRAEQAKQVAERLNEVENTEAFGTVTQYEAVLNVYCNIISIAEKLEDIKCPYYLPDGTIIERESKSLERSLTRYHDFLHSELCDPEKVNADGMRDLIDTWLGSHKMFSEKYNALIGRKSEA